MRRFHLSNSHCNPAENAKGMRKFGKLWSKISNIENETTCGGKKRTHTHTLAHRAKYWNTNKLSRHRTKRDARPKYSKLNYEYNLLNQLKCKHFSYGVIGKSAFGGHNKVPVMANGHNDGNQIISQKANIYYIDKKINLKQTCNMERWRIGDGCEESEPSVNWTYQCVYHEPMCVCVQDLLKYSLMVYNADVDKFSLNHIVSIYYILSITLRAPRCECILEIILI